MISRLNLMLDMSNGMRTGWRCRQERVLMRCRISLAAVVMLGLSAMLPLAASAHGYKVLYSFCAEENCADGSEPNGLIEDSSGNLYGTVFLGGPDDAGGIFELKRQAHGYAYKLLYGFCQQADCPDGGRPSHGLILDTKGNLYGTALLGGSNGYDGEIFELKRGKGSWTLEILYGFCQQANCSDGEGPEAGLTYAGEQSCAVYDGTSPLFGTTTGGGNGDPAGNLGIYGVAYEMTPGRSGWTYQVIYDFCSLANCADGAYPYALVEDASGDLYGGAGGGGGSYDAGTAFELANSGGSWSESVLYTFCSLSGCADGAFPENGLVIDSSGNLEGTTVEGGVIGPSCGFLPYGCGTAFTIVPGGGETVEHTFCMRTKCPDGAAPVGTPAVDAQGDLFSTTDFGGDFANATYGGGTLYELNGSTLTVLHKFCTEADCSDGGQPVAAPLRDSQGRLFGTASIGGANNGGVVYEYAK